MPRVARHFTQPDDPQAIQKAHESLTDVVNGLISFGDGNNLLSDNIDGQWVKFTTPASPNTDFTVTHNLGRLVSGFVEGLHTGLGQVYLSSSPGSNTNTTVTLRSSAGSITMTLFLF